MPSAKVRENRLRRMAARRGMLLIKSRRRDPAAFTFGRYGFTDTQTGAALTPDPIDGAYALHNLDEVEAYLTK